LLYATRLNTTVRTNEGRQSDDAFFTSP